jgi:hypothetical protein
VKNKLAVVLIFLTAGLWTLPSLAQDPKPPPLIASEMDANKDGKVDLGETMAVVDKEASASDVVKDVGDVVEAAKGLEGSKEGKALLIMVLLGTLFKFFLSAIKLIKAQTNWFHAKKAKRIIKYTTLGLGAASALVANLMFGMSWLEAAIILLSGPVSVAVHEYTKDSKDGSPDA